MEQVIRIKSQDYLRQLFGPCDVNLKLIQEELGVSLLTRKEGLKVLGEPEQLKKAKELITYLLSLIEKYGAISKLELNMALKNVSSGNSNNMSDQEKIEISLKGKHIGPRTVGQYAYIKAIKEFDIVFGIGPAGTGKTYLAMAMAVNALKKGMVRRIILTRPAIEAGESLGFLPGDINQKVSPYLRPLYDALYDMMEAERIEKYLEMQIIEVAPLAYMRGRTFNNAFIILDEAQNCTTEQMKMFLTRLGFDSKTVITGDITQSDLPGGQPKGLLQAKDLLTNIKGIKLVNFTGEDVVRHELVLEIIKAYANAHNDK